MSREAVKINKLTWMHVEQVTEEDTKFLREHYKFHPLDLKDCLGTTQRPKIDSYNRYLFFVFHFPYFDEKLRRVKIHELMVFVGKQYLVTVTNEVLPSLRKYWHSFVSKSRRQVNYDPLKNNSGYLLYKILDVLYKESLPIIDRIGKRVGELEDEVYDADSRETVYHLAVARRNIITLRRILEPQVLIVGKLVAMRQSFFAKDLAVYFDDVHDYLEKAVVTMETFRDTIEGLHETHQAIITQRTNNTIRILTVFSVAMLPLTVITGYYGMNVVNLPLAHVPWGLIVISGILISVFLAVLLVARQRKFM